MISQLSSKLSTKHVFSSKIFKRNICLPRCLCNTIINRVTGYFHIMGGCDAQFPALDPVSITIGPLLAVMRPHQVAIVIRTLLLRKSTWIRTMNNLFSLSLLILSQSTFFPLSSTPLPHSSTTDTTLPHCRSGDTPGFLHVYLPHHLCRGEGRCNGGGFRDGISVCDPTK